MFSYFYTFTHLSNNIVVFNQNDNTTNNHVLKYFNLILDQILCPLIEQAGVQHLIKIIDKQFGWRL